MFSPKMQRPIRVNEVIMARVRQTGVTAQLNAASLSAGTAALAGREGALRRHHRRSPVQAHLGRLQVATALVHSLSGESVLGVLSLPLSSQYSEAYGQRFSPSCGYLFGNGSVSIRSISFHMADISGQSMAELLS